MKQRRRREPGLHRSILLGAAIGVALGSLFLLIGLAGFTLAVLTGSTIQPISGEDVRMMIIYVGGFGLAGAFVGMVRPLLQSHGAIYLAMAVGGAVVMNTLAIGDKGFSGVDSGDFVAMTLLGGMFGIAAAYGFLRTP